MVVVRSDILKTYFNFFFQDFPRDNDHGHDHHHEAEEFCHHGCKVQVQNYSLLGVNSPNSRLLYFSVAKCLATILVFATI